MNISNDILFDTQHNYKLNYNENVFPQNNRIDQIQLQNTKGKTLW